MANFVREPEVFRSGERLPVVRDPVIEKVAWLMDELVPMGRWSFGLDAVIGLIPGLGDIFGALIGMIIVVRAVQAGIPRVAIARMMTNIAIDTLVGAIPLLGDAFDFLYKSNTMNIRIYDEALRNPRGSTARHWGFFVALAVGVGVLVWLVVMAILALIREVRAF